MVKYAELFSQKEMPNDLFDELDLKIANFKKQGIEVMDFGVGDPAKTLGVDPILIEKFNNSYAKISYEKFQYAGYPGNRGDGEFLNSAIAYLLAQHNIKVSNQEIMICNGSKSAVSMVSRIVLDVDDIIICPTPSYPNFAIGAKLFNAKPYFMPLLKENNFLIDFKSIPLEIANKAKAIWINYPNSPSGAIAPYEYLVELINWCHKYDIVLFSDEAYIDIYFDKPQVSPLSITKEGVLAFYSLSKSFNLTNARLGFIAGDEELIGKSFKLFNMYNDGVPSLIQHFGAIALDSSKELLPKLREDYTKKANLIKNIFVDIFNCKPANHSQGSIFLWQEVPEGFDDVSFCKYLLDKQIATLPGSKFSEYGKNYIRLALIQSLENVIKMKERLK
jgi:LL-diaminopimelate aminotransferase